MSLSDDARDKISPNPLVRNPTDMLIWAIIVIQIIVAIAAFPFLPAVVPIHWDASGQANGYGSKWVATILWPGISLGIYILMRVLTSISPRLGSRSSLAANAQVRQMLIAGIVLFMLIMQIVTTANILGMNVGMTFVLNLAISVLFIFMGNYMGKLRRNFWMGIRTPWTLTSDVVWERTHRLGGWLFVASGLIGIPFSFVPALRLWGLVALVILSSIFLLIYSYICYRQHTIGDKEPVSEPFDEGNEDNG